MIPVIGILSEINDERTLVLNRQYIKPLEELGALPLVLPSVDSPEIIDEFTKLCDGFLFTGGKDVEPLRYGEQVSAECGVIQKYRDSLELSVFESALKTGKPILGICRGSQLINVALGGSLYQDIPSEIPSEISHRQTEGKFAPSHSVKIVKDTPLHALIGADEMAANSFHHQAIKLLGGGLEAMAYAPDGIIEAIYYTDERYLRAYQWHPERLYGTDEYNSLIFRDFIEAAKTSNR